MKNNKSLVQLLNTYEIVHPNESQIVECIKQAKQAVQTERVRRDEKLWFLIETQLKFMRGEIALSLFFSFSAIVLLHFLRFFSKTDYLFGIIVGVAPFLVVPIMLSIVKSKQNGMLELETASKFSLAKIIAVRTIINQALAILIIFGVWLFSSVSWKSFSLNVLLFSLISFEMAAICFLWFGKSSIKSGVFSVAGWTGLMLIFLSWEKAIFWMQAINTLALFFLTVASIGISMMAIYGYIKNISFEREEEKWSLSWIA
ncbi:MAG: hypothetical protein IJ455_07760 [Agathobacter sp.]|nr:hypothetical protein [Agathobacter sp.]